MAVRTETVLKVLAVSVGVAGHAIRAALDEILTVSTDIVDDTSGAISTLDVLKVVADAVIVARQAVLAVEVLVVLAVAVVDAVAIRADELVLRVVAEEILVAGQTVRAVLVLKDLAEVVGEARITVVVFRDKATRVLRVDANVIVVAGSTVVAATVLRKTTEIVVNADTTIRAVAVLKVVTVGVEVARLAISTVEDAFSILADAIDHTRLAINA